MAKPQRKPAHSGQARDLVRRTTAMTDAMFAAFENAGFDVSQVRPPIKREASWRVTRKG